MVNRRALGEPLNGHQSSVYSLAFSPNGKILASGSEDRLIILWDLDMASWQQRACSIANRNLTKEEWRQFIGTGAYRKTCRDVADPGN